MFPRHYFAAYYFTVRYWSQSQGEIPVIIDTDASEYLFGQHANPISTLSIDLHFRDDIAGVTLSTSMVN